MTTRREPTGLHDDAPLRVVGHRLQQVDASARVAASAQGGLRSIAGRSVAPSRTTPDRSSLLRQVVLVDREIDALRDIAIALRDEYDFHITISGAEALNLLRDGAIDTIVVGQTLYSSTGLNVLAEARRHAPHTHRVLLANAVEAGSVERGAAAVAPFKMMQRPCTAEKLRELLEAPVLPDEDRDALVEQVPAAPSPSRSHAQTHAPADFERANFEHADFEHVVMETAPERLRHQPKVQGKDARDSAQSLPVVVYTDNAEFHQAIALALQDHHDLRLCTQLERAAELAEMGLCPLLVTDRAGTQVELQRISIALRALDAGMIIIAAGSVEVGAALRKLLGTSSLHSFLPKPLNAPLVRLAVESAKRQYLQARALRESEPELNTTSPVKSLRPIRAKPPVAPAPAYFLPNYRADFTVDDLDESPLRRAAPKLAIAGVLVLAALAGSWYWWQEHKQPATETRVVTQDLALAQRAYEAGRYSQPSNDSALFYYSELLKINPRDPAATAGLDRTVERIIEQGEKALIDEQLDAAAEAIATVRAVQPQNKRLPFLESQLDKERRQIAAKREARNAGATAAASNPVPINAAPISNETQRQQLIGRWLAAGQQRLAQDRLLTPENDSAEFYLRQAERADPGNTAVQQGLRDIGTRLLNNARDALARQQLETARRRADDALRFGADSTVVDRLRLEIESAAGATARGNFLRLVLQRTRDNRLFEPDRDNAKYYLGQLQRLDPSATETQQATRALALKLIENADQALAQNQMNTATQMLNEVRRLGFNGDELVAADARARTARNPPPPVSGASTTAVAAPKVIKTVPPKFPEDAMRAGAQGWVDVGFRITASGEVTEVAPVASNSPGQFAAQFERAAVAAIRQYKFEPRSLSGSQTQTMVVRVQFKSQ